VYIQPTHYAATYLNPADDSRRMEGNSDADQRGAYSSYLPNSNTMADVGGGTYTGAHRSPSIQDYEAIFGPSARDIKQDNQRFKRHQRWHLPDVLKGPNEYLTDRLLFPAARTKTLVHKPSTLTNAPHRAQDRWSHFRHDEQPFHDNNPAVHLPRTPRPKN
jgi:hypothetical protein